MFCQNCGAQIPEFAKFCGSCGARNEFAAPEDQPAAQNPQPMPAEQPISQMSQTSQPRQNPTDMLMNEYRKAAQPQPDYGVPNEPQPFSYTTPSAPAAAAVKKKRGKLIPGLCIAAGAVVVLGGAGAIVYNCNKANINHMIMGDNGYAYSVMMNAASGAGVSGSSASLLSANAGMTSAAENVMDSAVGAASGYGDPFSSAGSYGSESPMSEVGDVMAFTADYINEVTGMNGACVTMSGSLELDSGIINTIRTGAASSGIDSGVVDDVLEGLKSLKFSAAEKDSGSAYEYAAKLTSGNDSIVEAQVRYEKDGTLTVVFPGISDTGFTASLPAYTPRTDMPQIQQYDFSKLYEKIGGELREAFEEYSVQCTSGDTVIGGLKFSGLTVEIQLGRDEIAEMIRIVAGNAFEDKDFQDYMRSIDSSVDIDDMRESMNESIEELKSSVIDISANLKFYVNADDTVAGADLSFKYDGSEARLACLSGGNDAEIVMTVDDMEYFAVHVRGDSATSGRAEIDFTGIAKSEVLLRSESENAGRIAVYIDYKDVRTANIFGTPASTGSYTLSVSPYLASMMASGDNLLKSQIEQSSITVSVLPQGSGVVYTLGADIKGYGSGELVFSLDKAPGVVAPKPGGNYKLIDVDSEDSFEDAQKFVDDLTKHFTRLAESNDLVGAIYRVYQESQSAAYDAYDDYDTFDYYSF